MVKKRNSVKMAILLLVFTLGLNSTVVYGENMFTDVDSNHWAFNYIEEVVNLGLMDGYDDATFRPNEIVNTADALVYLTRLFNLSKEEVQNMRQKYDNILNKFQLSEERKDGLAIALSKGIVTDVFIENNLFVKDKIRDATKVEVAIYIAKALGMKETKGDVFVFLYKDTDSIPERARPYIKFLIDNNILEAKGDAEGKFNPNQRMIRSVLAKILCLTYGKMDKNPSVVSKSNNDEFIETSIKEPVSIEDQGQLSGIITDKVDKFIFIDNGQRVSSYTLGKNASITIDGNVGTIDELELGMKIKATIDEGNVLKSITVDDSKNTISGIIKKISIEDSSLTVDVDKSYEKTFNIPKETKVWINGKESYLFGLREGDWVEIVFFEDLALSISAESRDGRVEGTIKNTNFDDKYVIQVEREDKTIYEYELKESLSVYRNSNEVSIRRLRKGDRISLSLADGEVDYIEAKSIPGEDEGYIQQILISKEPKLVILNNKGEVIDYYISPEAIIKINKEIKNIYDLRLDYFAKLKLESNEIVSMEIQK